MQETILLLIAGLVGGAINAIAGGGGIIMYPALLAAGLPPLLANTTSSLVIWPGSLSSAYGYRKQLRQVPRAYFWLLLPCFIGAAIGSVILFNTAASTFESLAPWLVLSAVLLLALQSRIHRWLSRQSKKRKMHWHTLPLICAAVFPLAIYGGYFGVGFGLMMLAFLGFTSLKNVYQMNGLKNLCSATMAIVATVYFAHHGLIVWTAGLTMVVGTTIGGYVGSSLSQKVSAHLIHDLTVIIGLIISAILILK